VKNRHASLIVEREYRLRLSFTFDQGEGIFRV
jgi:hypothetical protein